jgi:hypothetical protein
LASAGAGFETFAETLHVGLVEPLRDGGHAFDARAVPEGRERHVRDPAVRERD